MGAWQRPKEGIDAEALSRSVEVIELPCASSLKGADARRRRALWEKEVVGYERTE
jgi:hypothetical protein